MSVLSAREGYGLWASDYETETAVSHLEDQLVGGLPVSTAGRRLLDVGCGTARRLRHSNAALAVGVDLAPAMLAVARGARPLALAVADVRALPVAHASFDVVWCRLMIGHVPDLDAAYGELSRVCRVGGAVIVTDIAPAAVAAGHRRTFRDARGDTREVEHVVHSAERHAAAARDARLDIELRREGSVGPSILSFYEEAGRLSSYAEQRGLPLVVVLLLRKVAG